MINQKKTLTIILILTISLVCYQFSIAVPGYSKNNNSICSIVSKYNNIHTKMPFNKEIENKGLLNK